MPDCLAMEVSIPHEKFKISSERQLNILIDPENSKAGK